MAAFRYTTRIKQQIKTEINDKNHENTKLALKNLRNEISSKHALHSIFQNPTIIYEEIESKLKTDKSLDLNQQKKSISIKIRTIFNKEIKQNQNKIANINKDLSKKQINLEKLTTLQEKYNDKPETNKTKEIDRKILKLDNNIKGLNDKLTETQGNSESLRKSKEDINETIDDVFNKYSSEFENEKKVIESVQKQQNLISSNIDTLVKEFKQRHTKENHKDITNEINKDLRSIGKNKFDNNKYVDMFEKKDQIKTSLALKSIEYTNIEKVKEINKYIKTNKSLIMKNSKELEIDSIINDKIEEIQKDVYDISKDQNSNFAKVLTNKQKITKIVNDINFLVLAIDPNETELKEELKKSINNNEQKLGSENKYVNFVEKSINFIDPYLAEKFTNLVDKENNNLETNEIDKMINQAHSPQLIKPKKEILSEKLINFGNKIISKLNLTDKKDPEKKIKTDTVKEFIFEKAGNTIDAIKINENIRNKNIQRLDNLKKEISDLKQFSHENASEKQSDIPIISGGIFSLQEINDITNNLITAITLNSFQYKSLEALESENNKENEQTTLKDPAIKLKESKKTELSNQLNSIDDIIQEINNLNENGKKNKEKLLNITKLKEISKSSRELLNSTLITNHQINNMEENHIIHKNSTIHFSNKDNYLNSLNQENKFSELANKNEYYDLDNLDDLDDLDDFNDFDNFHRFHELLYFENDDLKNIIERYEFSNELSLEGKEKLDLIEIIVKEESERNILLGTLQERNTIIDGMIETVKDDEMTKYLTEHRDNILQNPSLLSDTIFNSLMRIQRNEDHYTIIDENYYHTIDENYYHTIDDSDENVYQNTLEVTEGNQNKSDLYELVSEIDFSRNVVQISDHDETENNSLQSDVAGKSETQDKGNGVI